MNPTTRNPRNLALVLGDQLDPNSAAFDGFDAKQDAVWMAEASDESQHVWSTKPRIAMFLTAMRHFRDELRKRDVRVEYQAIDDPDAATSLSGALTEAMRRLRPGRATIVHPGEHRVLQSLQGAADNAGVDLEIREDRHFLCTPEEFNAHADGRKQLRLEFFYREMRRKTGVLMDGDEPVGGAWNFDKSNRETFGKTGPGELPTPMSFTPDDTTRAVIDLVNDRFADHPGTLEAFDWPVNRQQAGMALRDFIDHRLAKFGDYQDAMWTGETWLYHARLSSAMNLKLLNPRKVVETAEQAYRDGRAPINAVEGFIRQILGWREYVRGIYWRFMPEYIERNALEADGDLPNFYWTGETDMNCLHEAIGQTLRHGYAHHIQRLMVTGLFALLLGVHPRRVHEWYLAVYVDAVEWVELPNTLGMSQFADGGVMASKPYCATGRYVQRMSNYCHDCRYNPANATGGEACPFTTLYWDFLARHRERFDGNQRMTMQLRNLDRKDPDELRSIRRRARRLRQEFTK